MKKQFTAFALVTDGRDIWKVNIFTYDNADEARAVLEKFKSQYENSNISVIKTYIKEDNP